MTRGNLCHVWSLHPSFFYGVRTRMLAQPGAPPHSASRILVLVREAAGDERSGTAASAAPGNGISIKTKGLDADSSEAAALQSCYFQPVRTARSGDEAHSSGAGQRPSRQLFPRFSSCSTHLRVLGAPQVTDTLRVTCVLLCYVL